MTNLKPIQTRYKGYNFRSRLEARWAVFFDALGYKWEYEPEGFVLSDNTRYLPDFRTISPTGITIWYEIKPNGVADDDKVLRFRDQGNNIYQLCGDPLEHLHFDDVNPNGSKAHVCPRCGCISRMDIAHWVDDWAFQCQHCDMDTPSGGGHPIEEGLLEFIRPCKGYIEIEQPHLGRYLRSLHGAAVKARRARFEFGQSGAC